MGMPVIVEVADEKVRDKEFDRVFSYFKYVDQKFSTYKNDSEISKINRGEIRSGQFSADMRVIFQLSEETKKLTDGYFDILHNGKYDPSGIVKGWAIFNAGKILKDSGFTNYYVEAGGDIQISGTNPKGKRWQIGIKNPFNQKEIIKVVHLTSEGIATSGTYIRGQHVYNPKNLEKEITEITSLTVIGPNIYEADRFATAAFAMGKKGIEFIGRLNGFAGYMIDSEGIATYTSGFEKYTR